MVSLDEALVARLKKGSKHFEVLVDPDGALAYRMGEDIKLEDILAVESIFEDAKKGEHAAESDIRSKFDTDDVFEIAALIIKHGELQLTQQQPGREKKADHSDHCKKCDQSPNKDTTSSNTYRTCHGRGKGAYRSFEICG